MLRGAFHLFACRSGQGYAQKVLDQFKKLINERISFLERKSSLTSLEEKELSFNRCLFEQEVSLGKAKILHFKDDEMDVMLDSEENVRDKDVFLVQCPYNTIDGLSVSQNLMETFLFLDTLRRAKARSVTLVSLFLPYGRGDKQHGKDGVPASMLANLLKTAGMNNVVMMDLHADQITGFFDPTRVRVEHLHASPLFIEYFKSIAPGASIIAPDAGAAKRARFYADHLQRKLAISYKKRSYQKEHLVEEVKILGDIEGEEAIITDDLVSSGGSVLGVVDKLAEQGVKKVVVACTHALLTGDAVEKFDKAFADKENPFSLLVATDTVPHKDEIRSRSWYKEIDTSKFIAKALYEIHTSGSVTQLYKPFCVAEMGLWVE